MQTAMFLPESNWRPPSEYPRLWEAKRLALDLEVCDNGLSADKGAGWATGQGFVAGISFATDEKSWYFPVAHEAGGNLPKDKTMAWVADVLKSDCPKLSFHTQYDHGWLRHEGITQINGKWLDVSAPMPLLDENRFNYGLDAVAKDVLGVGKDESMLVAAARAQGLDPKADLWRLAPRHVGAYGQQDSAILLPLWDKLFERIQNENLERILNLELSLLPLLIEMRFRGVRFDEERAERLAQQLEYDHKSKLYEIEKLYGLRVDIDSPDSLGRACDRLKIPYFRTAKTKKPSFTKEFLEKHPHPFLQAVLRARRARTLGSLLSLFRSHVVDGRIHCQFNPLKTERSQREEGKGTRGTVSGRFSSSDPNLQFVPERDEIWGPLFRSLFLPEKKEKWAKLDYPQEEYRLIVHYAVALNLPGAREAAEKYKTRDADFHQILADMIGLPRKPTKNINFGIAYGEGVEKLAAGLGVSVEEARKIIKQYHENAPFMRGLSRACSKAAEQKGYVLTMLGRRCRFPYYEPARYGRRDEAIVFEFLTFEKAREKWPNEKLRRAFCYQAMNRVIQGTAGDFIKKAMVDIYRELGEVPLLTVHDELDFSTDTEARMAPVAELMANVAPIKLHVPLPMEPEFGDNWSMKEAA